VTGESLWAAATVALAVALDLVLPDPPNRSHPVAWVGRLLGWGRDRLEHGAPRALVLRGALLVLVAAVLAAGGGWVVSWASQKLGWPGLIFEALGLRLSICIGGLIAACRSVETSLIRGDLEAARRLAGYHLVSRPTNRLDEAQVASATIESAAENLTDAFVAPLCFYLAFGLAGAWLYRAVNTADAMLGYREGPLELFGKASARLDDLLNLIPARIAAVAIVVAAALVGERAGRALATMARDHARTAGPNAGWTMAAMAGALDITLEKVGAYRLGTGEQPEVRHVGRSLRLIFVAALGTVVAMLGLLFLRAY